MSDDMSQTCLMPMATATTSRTKPTVDMRDAEQVGVHGHGDCRADDDADEDHADRQSLAHDLNPVQFLVERIRVHNQLELAGLILVQPLERGFLQGRHAANDFLARCARPEL